MARRLRAEPLFSVGFQEQVDGSVSENTEGRIKSKSHNEMKLKQSK